MRIGRVFGVAAVAALIAAAGIVVGWRVLGHGHVDFASKTLDVLIAIATIATAVGTLLLAAGTFYLARQTRDAVEATQTGADAAREDLNVAQNQAEIAQAALTAQTQPFFTVGSTGRGALNDTKAQIRNAGNGPGVASRVVFYYADGVELSGSAIDPAVPPRDETSVRVNASDLDTARNSLDRSLNYSVVVEFADVTGKPRGVVRLDVYKTVLQREGDFYEDEVRFRVRQVFWADTVEKVRTEPSFGTQPND